MVVKVDLKKLKFNKLILIDKYIFPGYITRERYYTGLIDNLEYKHIQNIYFVPSIFHFTFTDLFSVYKKLIKSQNNYLFKEKFINFSDIIYAFLFFYKKK